MKQHNLIQGSPEWHAHRANHFNASDAPAMMGCSPYKTRTQLLHEKHTGVTPEVDAATQRRFDAGHAAEAAARPCAEEVIGEDLYPVVGTTGNLSASFDGMTMDGAIVWEHKLMNVALADKLASNIIPDQYHPQLEQQLMVSGAEKALFMATSSCRTAMECVWYTSCPELRNKIIAGWAQFEIDLAAYVPAVIAEMPKAAVTLALPALFIHAKGEITTSNMKEYGQALAARLESVRKIALVTDQDFSNAKESAKLLRENIEQAKLAKDAMLAQTVTVGEAARMIDTWCEDMRLTALQLEKDVEREDKAKKAAMVLTTKAKYDKHIQALEKEISPARLSVPVPVFAEALKNKRSFVSMQESLDTMLANAKIAADGAATLVRRNQAYFTQHAQAHAALFADKAELMQKPLDFVMLVIASRIADHVKAEAAKEEATRARIQAEEKAKAEAAARLLVEQEKQASVKAQEEAQAALPAKLANASASIEVPTAPAPVVNVVPMRAPVRAIAPTTAPTLKLGQIGERLGFSLTGEFLKNLGFEPAARDKSALLFHEASFTHICAALVVHIDNIQARQAA